VAQQVFNQWLPVAKTQNEQGQEVYLPFAGIHMQTRDGNDEVIVGAGNMVWTGSMWVPVSTQNRLPVDAAVSGAVDVSDRADRQLGQVTLSGSKVARVATQLPGNTTSGSPARNVNFIDSIAAATTVIIRDTTSPVIIESLYLLHGSAFTFSDLRVHFYLRDSGGNLRFVPVFGHDSTSSDGGFSSQYFSPERLKNAGGKSNLWELVAWNVDNYRQAIWRMLTPITALHGYRLVAENVNQTNSISVRFQVDIREVLLS